MIGTRLRIPAMRPRASARAEEASPATDVKASLDRWARHYGVDASLVRAVAWMESGYQNHVVSTAGAFGVMQVTPATWDFVEDVLLGERVPRTSDGNVRVGVVFLRHLLRRFGGDERLALAGYFQGPEARAARRRARVDARVRRRRARAQVARLGVRPDRERRACCPSTSTLLRIYLNDHLAASAGWLALARRTLRSNPDGELGRFLAALVAELRRDRASLERVLDGFGLRRNPSRRALLRAAVSAGRLKLNGQLRGYSDLSRVLELEGLALGVDSRLALWTNLRETGRTFPVDLDELVGRAERQRDGLEAHRLEAARRAFGTGG